MEHCRTVLDIITGKHPTNVIHFNKVSVDYHQIEDY